MTAPAASTAAAGVPVDGAGLDLEGAGVLSSWSDLAEALAADRLDPRRVAFAAAGAGLDALGAALYPLDALLQAGFGWLVEHVGFLREPLDALAGDPDAVLAQARRWTLLAGELRGAADECRAAPIPGWEGAAAADCLRAGAGLALALDAGAARADALARLVLVTGAAVGTVRAWVRDTVAEFAALAVRYLLAAGALAVASAGGSVAGFVLAVVARAQQVARDIAHRVGALLDRLAAASETAARLGAALRDTGERLRGAEPGLRAAGAALHRGARPVGVPVIEAGKQLTDALHDRSGWPGAPRTPPPP